jgi:hypothetical protein
LYNSKGREKKKKLLKKLFTLIEMDYNKVVCNNFQNCFYIIIYDVLTMAENMSNKSNDYKRDAQNDEIKSIVLGLFALIGFIIIVYSIFMGVVGEQLASVADTVFVAAIIGSFTLVGTIVGRIFLKK